LTPTVTFTVSVGQELTHTNIPLDTVQNRNKAAQIHGLLGLQTFIITLYNINLPVRIQTFTQKLRGGNQISDGRSSSHKAMLVNRDF
jgi:hypothetical protein